MDTCKVDNCENVKIARGLCHKHYKRWKNTGEPEGLLKTYPCTVVGCERKHYARGFCSKHFEKMRSESGYKAKFTRTIKNRLTDNIRTAKKRGLEWSISLEQFEALTKKQCHYCNNKLPETKTGLDRKDSNLGYNINNVVPCCRYCNQIKSNLFSYEEFLRLSKTNEFLLALNRMHNK